MSSVNISLSFPVILSWDYIYFMSHIYFMNNNVGVTEAIIVTKREYLSINRGELVEGKLLMIIANP